MAISSSRIGRTDVDASLIACLTPFGVAPRRHRLPRRPTQRSCATSPPTACTATSATRTTAADAGWCSRVSSAGTKPSPAEPTSPSARLRWMHAQATARRVTFPSRSPTHSLEPECVPRVGGSSGGRSRRRCCGPTRCTSPSPTRLGLLDQGHHMNLRNTARSGGHAYRVEPDQRHPVQPPIGEAYELRVLAAAHRGSRSTVEMTDIDGLHGTRWSRRSSTTCTTPGTDAEGHLDVRQPRTPGDGRPTAVVARDAVGTRRRAIRYRFLPEVGGRDAAPTEWFECSTCRWQPDGGRARGRSATQAVCSPIGPVALRRRRPGRASGSRWPSRRATTWSVSANASTTSTSAGDRLDAVVFEQYQRPGQSHLPPVAVRDRRHRTRRQGWGFHVRTCAAHLVRRRPTPIPT